MNIKHGQTKTKLYKVYRGMKDRCLNLNVNNYKYYGGRGITICPEWTNDYTKFRDWALNNGYQEGLEIDRIDNNGNYEPNNCRWVIHQINGQNRNCMKLTLKNIKEIRELYKIGNFTYKELSNKYNVDFGYIGRIINNKVWKNIV